MNSMTREMKDSGSEWIGKIPKEWEIVPAKSMFVQRNGKGNKCVLQLLSPTQKFGVIPQSLYEEKTGQNAVKLDEKTDLSALKTMHKGDYCISLRSFQGGFELSEYEGVVSPAYQVFYPIKAISQRYYKHLFKTQRFINEMNSYTMSLRDGKNIAFADFGKSYIPVPPLSEQKRIGNYLDFKCSQIDRLSDNIKQQMEELGEYKKALITQAVTKGLDPDVEMKDSGSEWIGNIPAMWIMMPLKAIATFNAEILGNNTDPNYEFDYVDIGSVEYGKGITATEQMCFKTAPSRARRKTKAGDTIISTVRTYLKAIAYIDDSEPIVSTGFAVIHPNNTFVSNRFLFFATQAQTFISEIEKESNGVSYPAINTSQIESFRIPLAPIEEQERIADFLNSKCSQIDAIIKTKNEILSTLWNYKNSLINDYVTGKREVPALSRKDECHE